MKFKVKSEKGKELTSPARVIANYVGVEGSVIDIEEKNLIPKAEKRDDLVSVDQKEKITGVKLQPGQEVPASL